MKNVIKGLVLLLLIAASAAMWPATAQGADFEVRIQLKRELGASPVYHFMPKGQSVLKEAPTAVLEKDKKYTVQVASGKLTVKDGTKTIASGLTEVTVQPKIYDKANHLYLYKGTLTKTHPYMGTVQFRQSGTTNIQPYNILQFEDYLKGVVPVESVPSWGAYGGMEALKAQAIAARSYVFSKIMSKNTREINDTTEFQVYKGFIWDRLSPSYHSNYTYTNRAVEETAGQVLTYTKWNGTKGFVEALFSASNGGQTELPEQYWSNPVPYLSETKPDTFDTNNVTWNLPWLKNQLPADLDMTDPASWWNTTTEYNLQPEVFTKTEHRAAFQLYKNHAEKQIKLQNPSVESIKIASVDNIATQNYSNTGKVSEISLTLSYFARLNNGNTLTYEQVPGAATKTLAGSDRYSTAIEIAREYTGAGKAEALVIGRGDIPADALSGTVLAHKHNAPIVLVRNDSIPESVQTFLTEKVVPNAPVYLLGGQGAISENVEQQLIAQGFKVTRLSGKDRTGTSLEIAKAVGTANTVMFATGNDRSSDALSASAYAAAQQMPIIIQRGTTLSDETALFLQNQGTESAILIGGESVVSEGVANGLTALDIGSKRISGADRVETSLAINKELPLTGPNVVIGNGFSFVDALAGSVLAAKTGSPIVMLHPDETKLPKDFFDAMPSKNHMYFLGGSSVVPDGLKEALGEYGGSTLKRNQLTLTFKGSKATVYSPTMGDFRKALGTANVKSMDFDIVNESDRFIMSGTGFGHGVGLSQWGAYRRSQAGQNAETILKFYFQNVAIEKADTFIK